MISLIRHLFRSTDIEQQANAEKLDLENAFLDRQIRNEELKNADEDTVMSTKPENQDEWCPDIDSLKACLARKGRITSVNNEFGVIDSKIQFDLKACGSICHLDMGCLVEYLTYRGKVIKVEKVLDSDWDNATENKLSKAVDYLKLENPTYFKTQLRNMLGLVAARQPSTIEVDTDYGLMTVELDNVEMTFSPRTGDHILMECKVQLDESYVDKQGELLEVLKILPSRMDLKERCVVEFVYKEMVGLSDNAFILKEDIPSNITLHLDDIVLVDLIECDYLKCTRRAIKVEPAEKNFGMTKTKNNNLYNPNHAVSFNGPDRAIFSDLWQKKTVTIKTRNNLNQVLQLHSIEVHSETDPQLAILEPKGQITIQSGEEVSLVFEVNAKYHGEVKESFTITFDKYKFKRSFLIVVVETEEEAKKAEQRLAIADYMATNGKTVHQRNRLYAHRVWSKKMQIVSGERMHQNRRFVAVRLPQYEVPDRLRYLYLTIESLKERSQAISREYASFISELTIDNYIQHFSLFLHLEEIEQFINFRNYDMERAHFQRNGEYLSLKVENLAERRPSLVVGDMVRAINIWGNNNSDKKEKCFEGMIHKVLFDRVLLKFNCHFQDSYNNSDYRLEFHFSRYALRKQHYAVSRVVKGQFGENFLFPSKLTKRKDVQLDLILNDNDDMFLYDTKVNWYNSSLNAIQKRAVFNILRGEAENMPYVIFGPPGTGKTVTLVETILQLLNNLPGARILVGTPSNSAADLITQRLIDSEVLLPGSFIRLVSQNQIEKEMIPPNLMSHCATVDIGLTGTCKESMSVTSSGLKLRCPGKFLGSYRVTISTCMTLGNFMQMDFPPGHFTHVLIDEAGQCTETETVIPIVLLSKQRSQVILSGDPHQLQSIVGSFLAAEKGFGVSFLERVLQHNPYCKDIIRFPNSSGYNPCLVTKLLYNYRALPSVMNVYSRLFYHNELIPVLSEKDSPQAQLLSKLQVIFKTDMGMPRAHGVMFCGVIGENMQDNDSPSWFNPKEAQEIFLTTLSLYRNDVRPDQIGIITPYVKQVKAIRNMFAGVEANMPKIGSVEEFQGQERDVILISTVRSNISMLSNDSRLSLGFVGCNRRMNVAISRARSLMVVVGNPHLLAVDEQWRRLILYCAENNSYFGCEVPDSILSSVNKNNTHSDEHTDG